MKPQGPFETVAEYSFRNQLFLKYSIDIPQRGIWETHTHFRQRYQLADETKVIEEAKKLFETNKAFQDRIKNAYLGIRDSITPDIFKYTIKLKHLNN